jgi:hypothetical protein
VWRPKSRTPDKWMPSPEVKVVHDPSAPTATPDDFFFVQNADGKWDLGHSMEIKRETTSVLAAESGVVWLHGVEDAPERAPGRAPEQTGAAYLRVPCSACGHSMRIKEGTYARGVACPQCAAVHAPVRSALCREKAAAPSPRRYVEAGGGACVASRTAESAPLAPSQLGAGAPGYLRTRPDFRVSDRCTAR